MDKQFQRIGSVSNAHVGSEFEKVARQWFLAQGIPLTAGHAVPVGASGKTKIHKFDLGSENPPTLVECKSHKWTTGGNIPSAKITVWNEAMYYFYIAPSSYRRILFTVKDSSVRRGHTLAAYYIRNYAHLIPDGVEVWEYDEAKGTAEVLHPPAKRSEVAAVEASGG